MEKKRKNDIKLYSSASEHKNREFTKSFKNNPVSDDQILGNLGLFLEPKFLSRILLWIIFINCQLKPKELLQNLVHTGVKIQFYFLH